MAEAVEIHVRDTTEGYDLMRALAVRGLTGTLSESGDRALIAIMCRREETDRLLADLLPALDEWRIDAGLAAIDVRVGARRYPISGHADIARCLAELRDDSRGRPLVAA